MRPRPVFSSIRLRSETQTVTHHHLVTVEVDLAQILVGRVAFEVQLGIAVVRIAVFDLGEAVAAQRVFRTGADPEAVGVDLGAIFVTVERAFDVVASVGVAALTVDQEIRRREETGTRTDIDVGPVSTLPRPKPSKSPSVNSVFAVESLSSASTPRTTPPALKS